MSPFAEVEVFVPAFGMLPQAVAIIDFQGSVIWTNPSFVLLTGAKLEALPGLRADEVAWPGIPHNFQNILQQVSITAIPWQGESSWRDSSGDFWTGDHTVSPLRSPSGTSIKLLWMIAVRQRPVDRLPLAAERYPAIFSAMAEGVVLRGLDGGIQACNESAERILGLSADQMSGRVSMDPAWGAICEDGSPFPGELHPAMVTLRTGQALSNIVMGVHKPDGSLTWISINSRALLTDSGSVSGVVSTFADITERKLATERAEQLQRIVSDTHLEAGIGVFEWSLRQATSRPPLQTLEFCNLDPESEPGFNSWLQSICDEDRPRIMAELRDADQRPEGRFSWEYRSRDGLRWIAGQGRLYRDAQGKPEQLVGVNIDITERKRIETALLQAHTALAKSEEHYRLIFNSVSDAIFIFTLDGQPLEVNAAASRYLGYSREELLEKQFCDVARPLREGGLPALVEDLRHRSSLLFEGNDIAKDGATVPVEVMIQLVELGGTEVLISCVRNITERQRMISALKLSEEKVAKVFLCSPAITTLSDLDDGDRIVEVNEAFERVLGYSRDEVIGRTSAELGLWADLSEFDKAVELFRTNGKLRNFEYHFRKKSGEIGIGLISAESVLIEGRTFPITSTIDITELKKTEHFMMTLATAVEQAEETVVITDVDGSIQYCNPAFERITGYSRVEALGQNPRILKSGRHDQAFYEKLWATLHRGEVWSGSITNKRKDGTLYHEDASISPLRDASGELTGYVAVKRDITERLKLEEQFRQAQRLESVGRLAGGIAHDFNNLLTVINGYTSLLLSDMAENDPSRHPLTEVAKAGDRAAGLTRQLLTFSRKQVVEPKVLNLNTTIGDAALMLKRLIREDIRLEIHLEEDLGLVMADADQIHQVVMNLAVNSRDAMPEGGTLTIATRNVEVGELPEGSERGFEPGRYVLLSVTDTGQGIETTIREQIFEPFFTTKEQGKGTGLGLSTVYGIVQQSGGRIDLWSEVGTGTSFLVYLPRIDGVEQSAAGRVPARAARGTETILVVEDQDSVRTLLRTLLESFGYKVLEASTGEEGLRMAGSRASEIDLLISDVIMPGMTGRALASTLAESHPKLKVLLVSGYTADVIGERGVFSEGPGFLSKPFSPAALAAKVRALLA